MCVICCFVRDPSPAHRPPRLILLSRSVRLLQSLAPAGIAPLASPLTDARSVAHAPFPRELHLQPDSPHRRMTLLACLLIACRLGLSLLLAYDDAPTSDEPVHLVAGLDQLVRGTPYLNPEHPPLSKILAAWTVAHLKPAAALTAPVPMGTDQWSRATQYLLELHQAGDWQAVVTVFWVARFPTLLAQALLLGLLFHWSRRAYGDRAGLLTLALAMLEPTLMGHGGFVTNDVLFSLMFFSSLYALSRLGALAVPAFALEAYDLTHAQAPAHASTQALGQGAPAGSGPTLSTAEPSKLALAPWLMWSLGLGVSLGLALGSKYSAVLLLPLLPLAFGAMVAGRARRVTVPQQLLSVAIVSGTLYITLAGLYGREPLLAWLTGFHRLQQGWHQFLFGEISTQGWYSYFVWAWLLKEPPALLLLMLLLVASLLKYRPRAWEWLVLSAGLLFFGAASYSRIGIGVRHILPVLLTVPLLTGRLLAPEVERSLQNGDASDSGERRGGLAPGRWRALLGLMVGLMALDVGLAWPHPLSYGSPLIGGSSHLAVVLSDSNLDWGQDFGRLQAWARVEAPEGFLSGVFTAIPAEASDVPVQSVPSFGAQGFQPHRLPRLPKRLFVAMSALNLQGVYFTPQGPFGRVPGIDPELYAWLQERPVTIRLSPSLYIWDISQDSDALYRLGMICLRFGWVPSARDLLERYLELKPGDRRVQEGLKQLPTTSEPTPATSLTPLP